MDTNMGLWVHIKSGGLYKIISHAQMECDMSDCIVYKSLVSSDTWVRPATEFFEKFKFKPFTTMHGEIIG